MDAPPLLSTSKSCFCNATQWIPARASVTAQSPFGPCSARKCARALSSVPSLRWSSRRLLLSSRFRNLSRSFASTSAMCDEASGQLGLVRLLDVADDALVEALDPRVARERDPLRRRRPADQALALDVAHDRRHVLRRVREHLHRARDQPAIRVALGPLVAVRVPLGDVPELQRVVAQVVVEVDQAGVDRPLRVDDRDFLEPGGRRIGRLLDGRDRPALHVDRAVVDDVLSVVHRHHTAVDREGRPVERIDGRPEDVAHWVSLLGATQTSVWPSSGEGRETWLLCRGWPVRPAASSPRKSGTPNGRSRRGIGA